LAHIRRILKADFALTAVLVQVRAPVPVVVAGVLVGVSVWARWIAVALVIFARWSPLGALAGGFLFGFMEALNFQAQAIGITIAPEFLAMLPYLFTILAVIVAAVAGGRRLNAPAALGIPYDREER